MKTVDAVKHFGSQAELARICGLSRQAVNLWGEYPPPGRQCQIELLTNGKLKAELKPKERVA